MVNSIRTHKRGTDHAIHEVLTMPSLVTKPHEKVAWYRLFANAHNIHYIFCIIVLSTSWHLNMEYYTENTRRFTMSPKTRGHFAHA